MPATKLTKLSVGTLLNAEDVTQRQITSALHDGIDVAAARLSEQRRENRRRAAIIGLLLMLSPGMVAKVRDAVTVGRQNARRAATRRLLAELTAAGVAVTPNDLGATRPLLVAAAMNRAQDDALHATAAAESLVTQWRGAAIYAAGEAEKNGGSAVRGLVGTKARMKPRIARTAATETAQAYSDEHRQALEDIARYDNYIEKEIADAEIVREWSALADACERCWPLNGAQAYIGESFPGGEVPGYVHPHCRCIEVLVSRREALKVA